MPETITGLKLSTTYTYRAYATTESETTYGDECTFTTLDYPDGISEVNADLTEVARYTMDGKRISAPQHGMNVVVYSDVTNVSKNLLDAGRIIRAIEREVGDTMVTPWC